MSVSILSEAWPVNLRKTYLNTHASFDCKVRHGLCFAMPFNNTAVCVKPQNDSVHNNKDSCWLSLLCIPMLSGNLNNTAKPVIISRSWSSNSFYHYTTAAIFHDVTWVLVLCSYIVYVGGWDINLSVWRTPAHCSCWCFTVCACE